MRIVAAGALVIAALTAFFLLRPGVSERTSTAVHPSVPVTQAVAATETFDFGKSRDRVAATGSPADSGREIKALESAVDPLRGNVVVSLGKVEDIGRQAGYILPALSEMHSLGSIDHAKLSPDQRQHLLDLQRRYAGMLGMLPEIAGFQNNPEEYGKFFSNMARQSAGLNEAQAAQVDDYMRARADQMIQSGLNEAKKPSDSAQLDAWETRRDQFNEQTVDGLRQLLSPQIADRAGINDQLMEFLETDFDKSGTQPGLN